MGFSQYLATSPSRPPPRLPWPCSLDRPKARSFSFLATPSLFRLLSEHPRTARAVLRRLHREYANERRLPRACPHHLRLRPPLRSLDCPPSVPRSSASQACIPQSARAQPRPHQHEHAESVGLQASYPLRVRHRLSPCSFKRPRLRTSCPHPWPSTLRRIFPSLEIPAARRCFVFGQCSQGLLLLLLLLSS